MIEFSEEMHGLELSMVPGILQMIVDKGTLHI
jgi:hypothetical protein